MRALFEGLKILEFGGGAAGPLGTRYFADHGAAVVRVESKQRPDFIRLLRYTPDDPAGLDGSHMFAMVNVNKYGIALNMSHPKAAAVARRLVEWCDILAENFAPKAMAKWGLDYETLSAFKPELIMVSTCLSGQTGPERNYPGFGGQGSALAGFNHLTGWPDREPLGPYGTITDSLSPRCVALLVGSALYHRNRTGAGQYIDLAQVEAGVVCLSENILTYTASGEILSRMGNRSRHAAPHGVFRCAPRADDDDRWIALAVHDDDDWQRFVNVIGALPAANADHREHVEGLGAKADKAAHAWLTDARFATVAGRLAHADELEAHIERCTRLQCGEELAQRLQAAGVEAAVVANFEDLLNDPQLQHRGHFATVRHPVIGEHLCDNNAMRFSDTAAQMRLPAPCLGEHTEYVMRELLGLPAEEFQALRDEGVFE